MARQELLDFLRALADPRSSDPTSARDQWLLERSATLLAELEAPEPPPTRRGLREAALELREAVEALEGPEPRYFLGRDIWGTGHRYLVPEEFREAWLDHRTWKPWFKDGYEVPDYALRLGPGHVTFTDPVEERFRPDSIGEAIREAWRPR